MKMKKLLTIGAIACIGLSLGGCSFFNNNYHDYRNNNYSYRPQPETLERRSMIKTFSENYYDAHSDKDANDLLSQKVNGYLESIKNLSQYNIKIRTNSVSDDGDHNGNQVQTDTVILTRK